MREPATLEQIQQLIVENQFDKARERLEETLQAEPENIDALYMDAVCRRYLRDFGGAAARLDTIKNLAPEHSRARQEEGHLFKATGDDDRALAAYSRACQLNPALEAAWRGQLEVLVKKGLREQALAVKAQLDRIKAMPRPLIAVMDLISQGRLLRAEEICRQFLQQVPHHVEAMRLLADIGVRFGVLEDAEFLLESAVEFDPTNIQARIDYIGALRKRQKFEKSLHEAKRLLDTFPDNLQFKSIYAIECMQAGDYDTALAHFDEILETLPEDPVTLTSRGHALKTLGKFDAAVESYRLAFKYHPLHGESRYSLANLKTYQFTQAEIEGMHAQEDNSDLSHMDRVYLFFALGKAYEDKDDFDRAFSYYEQGNRLKKVQSRYNASQMTAELQAQREICTAQLIADKQGMGCDAPDPIFVVGLPRAGSTLIEQILASHSQVDGTLELPNILSLSNRLRRWPREDAESGYPEVLADLDATELAKFGQEYIDDTRIHRQGAPRFIDKMPNNFRHIGLIKLILPNAKIIDARRHPMACCFSGYKQLFAEGQEFTYSLEDVGQYYKDYVQLMDHWNRILPGEVLLVQYEDVVSDLETQVRRMLDYLGLPFEESCLRYWETERSIRTPSSEQVRQPVYQSGVDQWKHFEPHLGPLKAALGDLLSQQ
ncbi:MAG TPA: sulfotransferase [Pseudomonadales bacterium]|nr:sulfotransferase [Pseudomonadales bacterium]